MLRDRSDIEVWRPTTGALDRFYVATRSPNGLPDLTPEQSYFRSDAEDAIRKAKWIHKQCCGMHATLVGR